MTQNSIDAAVVPAVAFSARSLSARSLGAMLLLAIMGPFDLHHQAGVGNDPAHNADRHTFPCGCPLIHAPGGGTASRAVAGGPQFIALGVMGITLGNVAQSFGVQATSAAAGTIISATIPIFIVIFAAIRLKQPVAGRQWTGLLVAFGGIALVAVGSGSDAGDVTPTTAAGVAWILVSAVAIAFYYIWSAELTEKYGTLPVAAWNALAGLVAILPLPGWELTHTSVQFTTQAVWAVVYLGVMVTVAGLLLWLYLLRTVPARVAASVQYLQPVFGIAAASAIFGDRLGVMFAAGVALILGGLALAVTNKRPVPERQRLTND